MPTMQVVGPNGESIPARGNAQGHVLVAFAEPAWPMETMELKVSRSWGWWVSAALHVAEMATIGYLIMQFSR